MPVIKACTTSSTVKNTGKECDVALGAPAMLVAVPKGFNFNLSAITADPLTWFKTNIHAAKADRIYPLFGLQAPIRSVNLAQENDSIATLDDGSQFFLRYGFYNIDLSTTSGGLCYAAALQSFNKSGYRLLWIDQEGKMLCHDNGADNFGGMITDFMYSPAPAFADLKTNPYMNKFRVSMSPLELVNYGKVLDGLETLLDQTGLIDVKITQAAAATTTKLKIGVETECAETDLVALIGAPLADPGNFIVKNKATGVVINISGAAVAGGLIELSGTFVQGTTYTVSGTDASAWYANTVEGYEAIASVDILIP